MDDSSWLIPAPELEILLRCLPLLEAVKPDPVLLPPVAVHGARQNGAETGVHDHAVGAGVVHHDPIPAGGLGREGDVPSQVVTLKERMLELET